ncbi:uncharacterized protein LOC113238103 [Hyposmocoma kahamanoa]|uniref:uncharacterized protein LOC113238103 n=1 Tax=Hyposmocoma kahamanoa TaxID=1477025 RepID=UPI000E6D754C|nr:uncharacterized protein LOC113238103 [Hyposmocoma kahamanoa]
MTVNTYTAIKHNWICPTCTMGVRCVKGDETPTRRQFEQRPAKTDDNLTSNSASNSAVDGVTGSLNITDANISDVLQELRAFRSDFVGMRCDIQKVTNSIQELNKKFAEMESRFSNIEDRLTATENKTALIPRLKQDLDSAKSSISVLENELQQRDQLGRMNNIEISGIPTTAGENLMGILRAISIKIGHSLDDRDIDGVTRVRRFEAGVSGETSNPRPPAIIVKFTRRLCKDAFLAAVRSRRGLTTADVGLSGPSLNLYVSDHLTPQNKQLLKRARQIKTDLGYSYLWVRDCKILIRKNERSKVIVIKNDVDISKLK